MSGPINLGMPTPPIHTLVVGAEPPLRMALVSQLTVNGFSVREASSGDQALATLRQMPLELVLLDVHTPPMSGLEICKRIRTFDSQIGIVMMSVRDVEEDKVNALEAGADDFVTKPLQLRLLVARLGAVRRRSSVHHVAKPTVHLAGSLELDVCSRVLKKNGVEVRLTPKEFDLLTVLMEHRGTPVAHRKLLQTVWGPDYGSELEYLRSYVKMLRKKIEDDPRNPQYILTDPWAGYRLRIPLAAQSA